MRDKFFRAQHFIYRHRGTFGYMAGIGVGCVVIASAKRKPYTIAVQLVDHTAEQAAKMLTDHRVLSVVNEKGSRIILVASDAALAS